MLNVPIKSIGIHKVPVALHPEVEVHVTVNVARSADEAERQAQAIVDAQNPDLAPETRREVARIVLHIDPATEPDRARRAWESHLARARWMTEQGFRHLLRGGAPH